MYTKTWKIPKIIFLVGVTIFVIYFLNNYSPISLTENVFLSCDEIQNKSQRYLCYKTSTNSFLERGGSVRELLQFSSKLPLSLHLKRHAIGKAALINSHYDLKQAGKMCASDCRDGFFHGIAEEWGRYAPNKLDQFLQFSKKYCPREKECFHELGHLYMTANNSFSESMDICNNLKDDNDLYWCIAGVVHQQFIDFDHRKFLTDCSYYSDRRKTACYQYGSALYPIWSGKKEGKDLVGVCKQLDGKVPDELNQCFASLRIKAQKKGQTPDDKWCNSLNNDYKKLCIEGLNSNVIPFAGLNCGEEDGISACRSL